MQIAAGPAAARRELRHHLRELGLAPGSGVHAVPEAELKVAQALDGRVSRDDMARAIHRARAAQRLEPFEGGALFGFTHLLDAKFTLTPDLLQTLAQKAGPPLVPEGTHPQNPQELVGMLIHHLETGDGASLQLHLTDELTAWVQQSVPHVQEAMGGAGAFCANLAATQGMRSTYYAPEAIPGAIARHFSEGVAVLGPDGAPQQVDEAQRHRVNYSAEYEGHQTFSVYGRTFRTGAPGRVILASPSTNYMPGFGAVSGPALDHMARNHRLFFFVGPHYYTREAHPESLVAPLAQALDRMKATNPEIVRHYQYVVPKVAEREAAVMNALAGHVDSMSLNSVEVPGLVSRLGLGAVSGEATLQAGQGMEQLVPAALRLKQHLHLSRLHIHGFDGDLLLMDRPSSPSRQIGALLRARQMASMKAANPSGEIADADDVWPVLPVVRGAGLAALYRFADTLPQADRAAVLSDWGWQDPQSGVWIGFVPSRGIHDATGGRVSLGDTIDATALLFGLI